MLRRLLLAPNRNLPLAIALALLGGITAGLLMPIAATPALLTPAVIMMIYPIMIGVQWREVTRLEPMRLLVLATVLNFAVIPLAAWALGRWLLGDSPEMFAGLAVASLLPTSGMTISWTMLSGGNVPAAVRLTVISLLAGSLLMPFYLLLMVGQTVPVDLAQMLRQVALMIIIPMVLGTLTHRWLMRRYTPAVWQKQIKPLLPAISVWAMLFIVFLSTASRAPHIAADVAAVLPGLGALVLFYLLNFSLSTLAGRFFLAPAEAYTLVYSTVLRNLSIAMGMALTVFGPKAALLIALAFMLQVQAAAWYGKVAVRLGFFGAPGAAASS